jgi:hypothetical protein
VCCALSGDFETFDLIASQDPDDVLLSIIQNIYDVPCDNCVNQHQSINRIFPTLCRNVFIDKIKSNRDYDKTFGKSYDKIFDKLMDLAVEHLPYYDLSYSKPFDYTKPYPFGRLCEGRLAEAAVCACLGNDIVRAERIFSIAKSLKLNLPSMFGHGAWANFVNRPYGEGFAFFMKHCKFVTEQTVLDEADILRERAAYSATAKVKFNTFFDFVAKHKLSKKTVAKYVTQYRQAFTIY